MLLTMLGCCMIGGGAKGLFSGLSKPVHRPVREHTPVYIRR